jgi:hypothetical protein
LNELFVISTKIIWKRLAAIDKNKSVWPDKAMIPYFACLLDITINNAAIPSDWKKAIVVPIYKGDDCSLVSNYRPVSLASVVSKQMEHVIASYLREIWDKKDWIFQGQQIPAGIFMRNSSNYDLPGHCRLPG